MTKLEGKAEIRNKIKQNKEKILQNAKSIELGLALRNMKEENKSKK